MSTSTELSIEGVDLKGRHAILRKGALSENYRHNPVWRVIVCDEGFGCSPTAMGDAVFATFVADGDKARFRRGNIERLATPDEVAAAVTFRAELGL